MNYQALSETAVSEGELSREQCHAVLQSPDADILQLLDAAFRVRRHFRGTGVRLHMLVNAKSGLCSEDCHYCSQSRVSTAGIEKYPWLSEEALLAGARRAKESRARRYCIVASGKGPTDREVDYLVNAVQVIKAQVDIEICCSVGLLSESQARRLKSAGVEQLNHNLNTSRRYYPEVCTTHTYEDRLDTLMAARRAGLHLCTGVIFGQGETSDDIIDVALALRALEPESLPVNFLHPIPGTPFENFSYLTPHQCLRILCLLRFLCPTQKIRLAGGREYHLRTLQPLALYPADSIFVDGYLTTPGQSPEEAWKMVQDMGFEVQGPAGEAGPAHGKISGL
jgi:biotin synthase